MATTDDPQAELRDEVGRALGFVLGTMMQLAGDGKPATQAELCVVLDQYRLKFRAFSPGVEEIVKGVLHGLSFALHETMSSARL